MHQRIKLAAGWGLYLNGKHSNQRNASPAWQRDASSGFVPANLLQQCSAHVLALDYAVCEEHRDGCTCDTEVRKHEVPDRTPFPFVRW
jgi:hypothetical protein